MRLGSVGLLALTAVSSVVASPPSIASQRVDSGKLDELAQAAFEKTQEQATAGDASGKRAGSCSLSQIRVRREW